MQIQPVLLVGGKGTRLAPLSNEERPKPFIPFSGELSLYQLTVLRTGARGFAPPIVIGNRLHRFALLNHARDVGCNAPAILLEHTMAGTAIAVALAAQHVLATQPHNDVVLALLPCDHWIEDAHAWQHAARALAERVLQPPTYVGLMGALPQTPEPGLGHIEAQADGQVIRFVEKPHDPAALMARGGTWFHNSGQFFATATALRDLFLQHAPDIWHAALAAHAAIAREHEFLLVPHITLPAAPSFDCAVLERSAAQCIVQPLPCAWADLGTRAAWSAYTDMPWEAQLAAPQRTERPWGYFYVQHENTSCVIKHLYVYPGKRLSLQRHALRSEEWQVVSGHARITLDGVMGELAPGDTAHIARGLWHRLENTTNAMLVIREVQEGLPDEADIERAEDDFGRVANAG